MPECAVRVGIVDSGVSAGLAARVENARAFMKEAGGVVCAAAHPDRLGHGSALADIITGLAPRAQLFVAQVFHERLACAAEQVAAAIDWLIDEQVAVINLSLGLRHDRGALALACARAVAAGIVVCAAAPARGAPVFPAAYPGVLRMTGDARCAREEISHLGTLQADFGAHVRCHGDRAESPIAGASVGCAYLSGHVARFLACAGTARPDEVRAWLIAQACHRGPERRA